MNRGYLWATLAVAFALSGARAQTLPAEKLEQLKRATVYIRIGGPAPQTGSGFVMAVEKGTAYALTNAHVVADRQGRSRGMIEVVLNSGTSASVAVAAQIAAVDPNDDVAVLSFTMEKPPTPLKASGNVEVPETTPVFALGFPFGQALANRDENPVVTVSRASISATRRDSGSQPERFQLDGELNVGNSGGPIVNTQGEVLAMAVAKVAGTNISFGIPIERATELLKGRLKRVSFEPGSPDAKNINLAVTITLLDPLERIATVAIVTAAKPEGGVPDVFEHGRFRRMPNGKEHAFTLTDGVATGVLSFSKAELSRSAFVQQVKYARKGGEVMYSEPVEIEFPESTNAPSPTGTTSAAVDGAPAEDFGNPPQPLEKEKTTKLAAEVEDVAVAGGGRYLVLKLRGMPALTVYDSFQGAIAKTIRLPSTEFLFAAGGNTAIVYLRDENLLQSFDLKTFEKRKTKPNPFGPVITNLVMGSKCGNLALVRHSGGTEQLSQATLDLLNTERLEGVALKKVDGKERIPSRHSSFRDQSHYRSSSELEFISEWAGAISPSGIGLLIRRGNQFDYRYEHDSCGWLAVGDDGRIYTATGQIWTSQVKRFGMLNGMSLVPAVGGAFYIGFDGEGKLTIYECGKTKPLGPIGTFPGWSKDGDRPTHWTNGLDGGISFDQRVIFTPTLGRIAFIPPENDRIVLRPFDLKAALDGSGVDYLVVVSTPAPVVTLKQAWTYQIETLSKSGGLKYSLELAPDGMKVSETGVVSWTPTEPLGRNGEKIVVLIEDKSGEQTYHSFVLVGGADGE